MNKSTTSPLKRTDLDSNGDLPGQMTLLEHLEELRDRLVRVAIVVFVTTLISAAGTPYILDLLIAPYGQRLQLLGPTEGISVFFRVALTAGLVVAMPYLIYEFLMFVMPGLEEKEKQLQQDIFRTIRNQF